MLGGVLGGPDGPLLHAAAATAQIPPSNQKQRLRGSRLKRLNRSARPRALEQLSQLRGSDWTTVELRVRSSHKLSRQHANIID